MAHTHFLQHLFETTVIFQVVGFLVRVTVALTIFALFNFSVWAVVAVNNFIKDFSVNVIH